MPDIVMEKMEHIEKLLLQLNAKIDNFLRYEDLTPGEQEELARIRREVRSGDYVPLDKAL